MVKCKRCGKDSAMSLCQDCFYELRAIELRKQKIRAINNHELNSEKEKFFYGK